MLLSTSKKKKSKFLLFYNIYKSSGRLNNLIIIYKIYNKSKYSQLYNKKIYNYKKYKVRELDLLIC